VLENGFVLHGRYEITDLLAPGVMGELYRARRVLLGDEVAIKTIRPAGSGADIIRQRFMREARACAQLRHPHIVSILDFNVGPDNQPYLVMEYLNGPSVKDELAAAGSYSLEQVRRIAPPLCGAIQVAHDHGIVHRDLKPANLVSHRFESGEVVYKVIDFGVANMRAAASEARLTQADEFVGTISYASPEPLESQEVDGRTDVYSFAAVVFEMPTGCPPFVGPTPAAVLTKHLCEDPPAASSVRPGLPPWLDDVLRRGLAKRPDERWPTIAAFGRALQPADDATFDAMVPQAPGSGLLAKYDPGPQIAAGRLGSVVHAGTHRALGRDFRGPRSPLYPERPNAAGWGRGGCRAAVHRPGDLDGQAGERPLGHLQSGGHLLRDGHPAAAVCRSYAATTARRHAPEPPARPPRGAAVDPRGGRRLYPAVPDPRAGTALRQHGRAPGRLAGLSNEDRHTRRRARRGILRGEPSRRTSVTHLRREPACRTLVAHLRVVPAVCSTCPAT
jgi:hypothetical protein